MLLARDEVGAWGHLTGAPTVPVAAGGSVLGRPLTPEDGRGEGRWSSGAEGTRLPGLHCPFYAFLCLQGQDSSGGRERDKAPNAKVSEMHGACLPRVQDARKADGREECGHWPARLRHHVLVNAGNKKCGIHSLNEAIKVTSFSYYLTQICFRLHNELIPKISQG